MDSDGLEVSLSDMLKAFELAGPYASGKTNTAKLNHRMEVALSLIDWAVTESDRGVRLLEAESELALTRKSGGGQITLRGPFDLG